MSLVGDTRRPAFVHAALTAAAIVIIVPVVWVVTAGFRTQISLLMGALFFQPILGNFNEVLFSKSSEFILNFRNSLIVGTASTALTVGAGSLAAWSLQRMHWPGWVIVAMVAWALLFQMIPPIALAGAWYTLARQFSLDNTFFGLVLAHATLNLPLAFLLMSVFVREVPKELEEAAIIDGASTPLLLWHVVRPVVAPGIAATTILCFVFSWNEFAVALNLTRKQTATVPAAIAKFAQEFQIQYTQMAAAAALSMIPALILLVVAQRYIVKGLTQGALR